MLHCIYVIDVANYNVGAIEEKWCGCMGERGLCFGSAGNSGSGYTKNCSFCFLDFVIEFGIVCCIVEDKEQHVTCIVEMNKLKILEAVVILAAQTVMVVGVVGYIVIPHLTGCML